MSIASFDMSIITKGGKLNSEFSIQQKHYSGATDRLILNEFDVLCRLHEEGCPWFGCIADYQV